MRHGHLHLPDLPKCIAELAVRNGVPRISAQTSFELLDPLGHPSRSEQSVPEAACRTGIIRPQPERLLVQRNRRFPLPSLQESISLAPQGWKMP